MFRTIAVGDAPQKARDWYLVCQEALNAAMEALKPGNLCSDPHEAAQAVIDRAGATEGFRKRTGYSIGISFAPDWGEGNIMHLNKGYDVELVPGMVFHVPITLRDYAKFTVAISETIAITQTGCRALGTLPSDLVES